MAKAISGFQCTGFQCTGIQPLNPNIFTEDFLHENMLSNSYENPSNKNFAQLLPENSANVTEAGSSGRQSSVRDTIAAFI